MTKFNFRRSTAVVGFVAAVAGSMCAGAADAAVGSLERLLAELGKAQTAAQAGDLLKAAKLSEAEMAQLDRELAKPEWAGTLAKLRQTIRKGPADRYAPRLHLGESPAAVVQAKNQALAAELRKRILLSQQAVRTRLAAPAVPVAVSNRAVAMAPHPPRVIPSSMRAVMKAQSPEWPANISRVEPASPVVGQPLTLVGTGFGSSRGGVLFVVGENLIEAEVTGWTSSRVTARVPFEALPWDSMADVPNTALAAAPRTLGDHCLVWIQYPDGTLAGGTELWVVPDLQLLTPAITAVTPGEATPGSEFLVEGTNFGAQPGRDGRVSVMFGSYGLDTLVREWRDNRIRLQVPESVVGVQAMTGGIVGVTNVLGLSASRSGISFAPAEVVSEMPTRTYVTMCHPAGHPLFCWWGDSHEVTPWDRELLNGWKVEEVWVDVNEIGANAGAYFDHQAAPGDTRAHAVLIVWCDGLSRAEATPHMTVKGPRGTDFH